MKDLIPFLAVRCFGIQGVERRRQVCDAKDPDLHGMSSNSAHLDLWRQTHEYNASRAHSALSDTTLYSVSESFDLAVAGKWS